MKTNIIFLSAVFLFAITFSSCSDEDHSVTPTIEYISADDYVSKTEFQGSILLKKGTETILRKGYGIANETENNKPETRFRIGSMSKAFVVMGIIALKREGLITSFDQKISDFDDEFPQGDQITLRHMLTHSSGLPLYLSVIEDLAINQNMYFTPEDIYEIIAESVDADGLHFTPGAQYEYSNSNYLMLALLIEEVSGKNYHDYIEEVMLTPLGMNHTEAGSNIISGNDYAKGYKGSVVASDYPMNIAFGAGEWSSNLTDLEAWGEAVKGSTWFTEAEKTDLFATPYHLDGYNVYGMGWLTTTINGKLVYYHGGRIDGFSSVIAVFPESDGLMVALSNQDNSIVQLYDMLEVFVAQEF